MKTPDESKCGMECIRTNVERICVKPEKGQCPRCEQLVSESLARIQQLESRLAQVEKERDAAVKDLYAHDKCLVCKQELFGDGSYIQNACFDCVKWCNFKWRGACAENSKEES